jgi:hypothetical protein
MTKKTDELISLISDKAMEFQKQPLKREEIIRYKLNEGYLNELLFFIKPEITQGSKQSINRVLKLIFESFDNYNLKISGLVILGAEELKKYDLISKHYGVINAISKHGLKELSEQAKINFDKTFHCNIEQVKIYGPYEFMEKFDYFNELSLNVLWENQENFKLSSGIFCEKIKVFEEEIYVLNGFHPHQISNYTKEGSFIIVFALQTNTKWNVLRKEMIGATDASKADKNTLRRVFFDNKNELGTLKINQGYNGVHLSAGPIEALSEIIRFMSNYDENKKLNINDTAIGKYMLKNGLKEDDILLLLKNPIMDENGRKVTAFALTEEMDLNECINVLKKKSTL